LLNKNRNILRLAFHLTLIVEYNRVFPELHENVEDLSIGIPKLLFLQAATTFLQKDLNKSENYNWKLALRSWFRQSNTTFFNEVSRRIYNAYGFESSHLQFYSPISDLKLLQKGLSLPYPDSELTLTEEQIEINLFKIYIKYSQNVSDKHIPDSDYIKLHYPNQQLPCQMIAMGFATCELINYSYKREIYCQTVKAFFLFAFLKNYHRFSLVVSKFCEYYGIQNIQEYYGGLKPLLVSIAERKDDGFFAFNIPKDKYYERNKHFISSLAIQQYSPEDDIDFKEIRSQPFVQIEEDKYRITHPIFFSDKLFKGIFFVLSRLNSELPLENKIANFRSEFSFEFSEMYLFYQIIQYSFINNKVKFSGNELKELKIDGAPDYYIRSKMNVFLFENKDVLINAKIKEESKFEDLEKEFKKKFLNDGKKPKGIKQILNDIIALSEGKYTFDSELNIRAIQVYPIIVVQDIMFDCPGFNHLLNSWFVTELDLLRSSGMKIPVIKPLVILNIDTLILMSDLLKNDRICLEDILNRYYKMLRIHNNKIFKTTDAQRNYITSTFLPAGLQIENWLKEIFPNSYGSKALLEYAHQRMMNDTQ
jgi:hypothetical protein